jgi:antitoxin ParD1/3/4
MPSSYTLGSRFETLIKDLVTAGRYNNASEVVRDGLRMIEERERRLASLDAAIVRGLADADAGRVSDIGEVRTEILQSLRNAQRGNR